MSKKYLIYAMQGEKMCFLHALMNARQLKAKGHEVRIVLEGAACKQIQVLEGEKNSLYLGLKEDKTIAGVCLACSKVLGVYDANVASGIPMLNDMMGHAGIAPYAEEGYETLLF